MKNLMLFLVFISGCSSEVKAMHTGHVNQGDTGVKGKCVFALNGDCMSWAEAPVVERVVLVVQKDVGKYIGSVDGAGNPTGGYTQSVMVVCPEKGMFLSGGCMVEGLEDGLFGEHSMVVSFMKIGLNSVGIANSYTCGFRNIQNHIVPKFVVAQALCLLSAE